MSWEESLPDLHPNPPYDKDYLAAQSYKHLVSLDKRITRSIAELQEYQRLVVAEIAVRQKASPR
jgi:hypothetical protein